MSNSCHTKTPKIVVWIKWERPEPTERNVSFLSLNEHIVYIIIRQKIFYGMWTIVIVKRVNRARRLKARKTEKSQESRIQFFWGVQVGASFSTQRFSPVWWLTTNPLRVPTSIEPMVSGSFSFASAANLSAFSSFFTILNVSGSTPILTTFKAH